MKGSPIEQRYASFSPRASPFEQNALHVSVKGWEQGEHEQTGRVARATHRILCSM